MDFYDAVTGALGLFAVLFIMSGSITLIIFEDIYGLAALGVSVFSATLLSALIIIMDLLRTIKLNQR
tara:strand:+ start:992 stop:1192 length:201 start_codon:yes stop_codon:yes gene_type:complete